MDWIMVLQVMEVNKRWQQHHSERELYVQKLLNTISELRAAPPLLPAEPPSKEVSALIIFSIF
jgi:hypothetical protein